MTHGETHESRLDERFDEMPARDVDAMRAGEPDEAPTVGDRGLRTGHQMVASGGSRVRCLNCGYDLTGATIGGKCPECGLVIGAGAFAFAEATGRPTSGNAIAALVLGICALVLGCGSYGLMALICGPLAILFARRARADVAAGRVSEGSAGLATAGRVMGWIALGLLLAGGVIVALMLGIAGMGGF